MEKSPILRQYQEIKSNHSGSVLLFQRGAFYISLDEDALIVTSVCSIKLRHYSPNNQKPMCGFPVVAVDEYLSMLTNKGHGVVICDQVDGYDPQTGQRRREVKTIRAPSEIATDTSFPNMESKVIADIMNLHIETMTPIQALLKLAKYQEMLRKKHGWQENSL